MCYNVEAQLKTQLKRAEHYKDQATIKEIEEKMRQMEIDFHHAGGFAHPKIAIYTNEDPFKPVLATWGLIPFWVKDEPGIKKIWNNTLNARGETIFEKPSFRDAAKKKRCLIVVDGFYEYHHKNNIKYPFYVFPKNQEYFILAGLWSEWTNKETGEIVKSFTIVTTEGNEMMAKIHNNPKATGPRMPVILPEERVEEWLAPINEEIDKKAIQELIQPYPDSELDAYTVGKLAGKEYIGNVQEVKELVKYPELELVL